MTGPVDRDDRDDRDAGTAMAVARAAVVAELAQLPKIDPTLALRSLMRPVFPQLIGSPSVPMHLLTGDLPRISPAAALLRDVGVADAMGALCAMPKPLPIPAGPMVSDGAATQPFSTAARKRRPAGKPRRFVAAATAKAQAAATIADFGDALRALHTDAGWSQKQLAKHFGPDGMNLVGLSKTVLSSVCNGYQMFQTEDQVRHIVTACWATPDLDVWIAAYHRAKHNGGRRPRGGRVPAHTEPVSTAPGAVEPVVSARPVSLLTGPDNEVVHVLQVPITRGQMRAALTIIAVLGVVASSSSAPVVRAAGLAAIGFAAATAGADQAGAIRPLDVACSTTRGIGSAGNSPRPSPPASG